MINAVFRSLVLLPLLLVLTGCSLFAPAPPANQNDVCAIFAEQPDWYDYAERSRQRWGTPIGTQMAFVQQESSFRSHVRPPRTRLLGFIPWRRPSSAYGYAQAQDPVWGEYRADAGSLLARRTHMKHALDFIGWYNRDTQNRLGISLANPEHLYLAYHEGRGGYARGSYRAKPHIMRVARRVNTRAARYQAQLQECEEAFRCDSFYQFWPFCR